MLCFLLLCGGLLWALSPDSALARSANALSTAKIWSLDFEMEVRAQADSLLMRSRGSLLLGSGDRFRLKLADQEYMSDGVSLWHYVPAQKQVLVKNLADAPGTVNPSEMLFRYLRCRPLAVIRETESLWRLQLDPTGQIKAYRELEVWLNGKTWLPEKLSMRSADGSRTDYRVLNLLRDPRVSERDFRFVQPNGVELIDMR